MRRTATAPRRGIRASRSRPWCVWLVSQEDLRSAFNPGTGWTVAAIEPDRVQTRFHDEGGAPAWLATVKRT